MSAMLYTHSKKDLEEIVKIVITELRKTEEISDHSDNVNDKLSQKEAAMFLGVSQTSIISWKKQGKIPYYQIGKTIFYSKSELLSLARQNRELLTRKA